MEYETFSKIDKCSHDDIPALFASFPEELKRDAVVRNRCIEKALNGANEMTERDIKLRERNLLRKSWEMDGIPDLFSKFPDDVKMDADVRNRCMDLCVCIGIPQLFAAFPDEVKDSVLCSHVVEKCDAGRIPDLFRVFPASIQEQEFLRRTCIEKCSDQSELFDAFPSELRTLSTCLSLIDHCSEGSVTSSPVRELFKKLPDEMQRDTHVCSRCIKRSSDYLISKLYEAFADEVKRDPNVLSQCLEKCIVETKGAFCEVSGHYIPTLFEQFPDDVKKDISTCSRTLERCSNYGIVSLFRAFPGEVQRNSDIRSRCIDKIIDNPLNESGRYIPFAGIPGLFAAFPDEVKKDADVYNRCIDECKKENVPDLFAAFPDELKRNPNVRSRCESQMPCGSKEALHKLFSEADNKVE